MEGRTRSDSAVVQISKGQYVLETVLSIFSEATVHDWRQRVLVGSEHDVEDGEIRVVVRVVAPLVMHAMRFGSLENGTKPTWGANVPVIEELRNSRNRGVKDRGRDADPEERIRDRCAQNRVQSDLVRMLIERRQNLDSAWRVVKIGRASCRERVC